MFPFVGAVMPLLDDVLKRIFPDKAQQDAARLQLFELQQKGALAELDAGLKTTLAQLQINDDEAKSGSLFVSGPRPAIMWICAAGLGYQWLARPFLAWGSAAWWHIPVPPSLELGTLMTLLGGLLGMGTLHVAENVMGSKAK